MSIRPQQKDDLAEKIEKKLAHLFNEIEEIHRQHNALANQMQDVNTRLLSQIEQLQKNLQANSDVLAKQAKNANIFEQQINGVRTDTTAAVSVVTVVYAILFIVSLLIR